ncbi:hypothetical protein [Afipia clevelandensis]|uniref:Twin-arginine translocation pathway signal n=1 Tax=Afipia clevelandensis ATCC 49720 TaxID=883079 RepID=K8PGR8_9BRAD|nr:hypothetical protein [Afipia clevelandensis]EKS37573.1 hypothetical protein HMPREF9696_01523 [Afipia clevelandensis ATCC 49720]
MKPVRMTEAMSGMRAKQRTAGALRFAVLGVIAASLSACASSGGESPFGSSVFVDPSKYDLYNCEQLATARKSTNDRVVELEGLMAKAESGAGGALVSGLAYQTDYRAQRAQRDAIDEKLARNNCSAELAAPATRRRR